MGLERVLMHARIVSALRRATGNSDSANIFGRLADFAIDYAESDEETPLEQAIEDALNLISCDISNAANGLANELKAINDRPQPA